MTVVVCNGRRNYGQSGVIEGVRVFLGLNKSEIMVKVGE